ncbi:uncharacterized protein PRCAT00003075001 [Priceomyces carsonii]|uniref:uncharacterized protein n=1 Tax=Priceomyces carsonii TaxID=28549 RepID=UPI002ED889C4|nr:unnamed protein product [Priceomyces carsonii]
MPLFREENFLVVHPGSENTLFSFGLRDSLSPPQYKIPSIVYQDPSSKEYKAKKEDNFIEIRPIKQSKIVDLEAFNALLKVILLSVISNNPIITINQIPLLLLVPSSTWSRAEIEYITKYVFETLELTAFNILDIAIASNFGIGTSTSSLVVNLGSTSTEITPVINHQSIKFASKYLPGVGGAMINEQLKKLLPTLNDQQIEDLKTSGIYEVLNNHDGTFYSFDLNNNSGDDSFDVAKLVTESNGDVKALEKKIEEEEEKEKETAPKKNSELDKNFFVDSKTKEKIMVGKERFSGSSVLVSELSEAIYNALLYIPDLEKRQECYDNLIFVGSTFKIPGLKDAVIIKLANDHLVRPNNEDDALKSINSAIAAYQRADEVSDGNELGLVTQVPSSIRASKYPEYFPEWKNPKERGGSWEDLYFLGGSIYSKQIFGANSNHGREMFIDTEIYEEYGPQGIWNVSI